MGSNDDWVATPEEIEWWEEQTGKDEPDYDDTSDDRDPDPD